MAAIAADQLRFAELNEMWEYMESLLRMLKAMGARVMRLPDKRFQTLQRGDYMVVLSDARTLPGI
jgi:hypothetical protein